MGFGLLLSAALVAVAEVALRLSDVAPADDTYASREGLPRPELRLDAVLGPRPRPGYTGAWLGRFPVVIDARGFRAATSAGAVDGTPRIALLGDSCSFGWGLATEETFAAGLAERAQRAGRPIDVLNAAYPGDSAIAGPLLLRMQVLRHAPRVAVLGYSGNNAFRIAAQADAERLRFSGLRRLLLRSRLVALADGALAVRTPPAIHPREWEAYRDLPLSRWRRVASPEEVAAATREMIALLREQRADPVLLILPRASQVSSLHGYEDAAVHLRAGPLPGRAADGRPAPAEASALEYSCADVRRADAFLESLYQDPPRWHPFYPSRADARQALVEGARAYVEGRLVPAEAAFRRALDLVPDSPVALYDLASIAFARGRPRQGLELLERAQRASCNVFLGYQIALWRVATELGVPVVDLMLHFQAHAAEALFLDPAHPSAQARDVIAAALWPVVEALLDDPRAGTDAG